MDHLAVNSTTALAGKAGFTLASAATAMVEFVTKWLNLYPRTVYLYLQLEAVNTGENHSEKHMEQKKTFLFNLLVKIGGHRPNYS